MYSYQRQLVLILVLTITFMSLGIYGVLYNMRKNTLEPVPTIIGWEKSGTSISVRVVGVDYSLEDGAQFVDRILNLSKELENRAKPALDEISAEAEDYRQKVQTYYGMLMEKIISYKDEYISKKSKES